MSNTYGHLYRLTSFGESHGEGLGVVIDGVPSGIDFDEEILEDFLNRRRPGGALVSSRQEKDKPQILSGVFDGKTLGTPLACIFKNMDARSKDYEDLDLRSEPRRGHADEAWSKKHSHIDFRGGGRSSGRETLARVVAGAVAKMSLKKVFPEMEVKAVASSIYNFVDSSYSDKDFFDTIKTDLGFLSKDLSENVGRELLKAKEDGDSFGGVVEVRVKQPVASLGQPVFGKLKSRLAEAVMSVGAVKSFSLGDEVDFKTTTGKNFHSREKTVYGGILGGLSTGDTIKYFAEVKPTSSILDVAKAGRHDPCIVPRVLVVLEAMTWVVLMDLWLHRKTEA